MAQLYVIYLSSWMAMEHLSSNWNFQPEKEIKMKMSPHDPHVQSTGRWNFVKEEEGMINLRGQRGTSNEGRKSQNVSFGFKNDR